MGTLWPWERSNRPARICGLNFAWSRRKKLTDRRATVVSRFVADPEIAILIAQYEMAFQLQDSIPRLMDANSESQITLELYGGKTGDGSFAANCLLARRLAERGVRFIQLYYKDWDYHGGVKNGIELKAKEIDQPCAALINDLKMRGMWDDTLIVWAGEFGRTPMSQDGNGRDHHNKGFTIWLSGVRFFGEGEI